MPEYMAPTKTAQKNSILSIPSIPILRPQYRLCTMYFASREEYALLFFERHAQGRTLFLPGVREKAGFYERNCEGVDYLSMTEAVEE